MVPRVNCVVESPGVLVSEPELGLPGLPVVDGVDGAFRKLRGGMLIEASRGREKVNLSRYLSERRTDIQNCYTSRTVTTVVTTILVRKQVELIGRSEFISA